MKTTYKVAITVFIAFSVLVFRLNIAKSWDIPKEITIYIETNTPHLESYFDNFLLLLQEQLQATGIEHITINGREKPFDGKGEADIGIYFSGGGSVSDFSIEAWPISPSDLPSSALFGSVVPPQFRYNDTSEMTQIALDFIASLSLYAIGECEHASELFNSLLGENSVLESNMFVLSSITFYAGNCAILQEDYESAAHFFNQSIENMDVPDPDLTVPPQVNLAWTYIQLGQDQVAFELMDKVVADGYLTFDRLTRRAKLYALVDRYDDAITDLTTVISPRFIHSPDLHILRGKMYLAQYEWDSALADYNTAIELDPDSADAYYERGVLYYSILQTGVELRMDALADFQKYLELAPEGEKADDASRYIEQIRTELEALNG